MHTSAAMRVTICCVLAILAIFAPAQAAVRLPFLSQTHPTIRRNKLKLGDWRLTLDTANFSGEHRCRLQDRKHHIVYAAGALGFHFRHHPNTLDAWMRIDGGEPTRWKDNLPELLRLGAPIDGASLDNPTDSIVWIPARALEGVNSVTIQPSERRQPTTYHLRGFSALRDMAREMGCTPERRFVR